jgi:hypothetical protein
VDANTESRDRRTRPRPRDEGALRGRRPADPPADTDEITDAVGQAYNGKIAVDDSVRRARRTCGAVRSKAFLAGREDEMHTIDAARREPEATFGRRACRRGLEQGSIDSSRH